MIVLILCLLLGMVLGQRFKVLVMLPATIVVVVALTIAGETAHTNTLWLLALTVVAAAASLQIGYFLGLGIRHFLVDVPASPLHSSPLNSTTPTGRALH
jgi:hypothetical protein